MKPFKKAVRAWHYLKRHGLRATLKKIRHILLGGLTWRDPYTAKKLREQRTIAMPDNVTVSILTPLYNTPLPFLREMIESVIRQTYSHWELCLVDGSDDAHGYVGRIATEYAGCDPRIRYQKLERNLGISQNTNACIEMSCGEYLALLDHDDVLHPAALLRSYNAFAKSEPM